MSKDNVDTAGTVGRMRLTTIVTPILIGLALARKSYHLRADMILEACSLYRVGC